MTTQSLLIVSLLACSRIAHSAPLRLGALTGSVRVARYGVEEISVDASGTFDNPFDPTQVRLDAVVHPPAGNSYSVPGFLDLEFDRGLQNDQETLTPKGLPVWKLRIQPQMLGRYAIEVVFRDNSGSKSTPFSFESVVGKADPPLRVSERDPHYFELADGSKFFPVGENLAWAGARGTFDYSDWLDKLGKSHANFVRLWLGPSWSTFAMERKGDPTNGLGPAWIDLASAWKLDQTLAKAGRLGIRALLCLDSAEELQIRGDRPDWQENPLNQDNDGPLRIWTDFWSNPAARKIYEAKLRYLVARYSAENQVFGWELWNDVDQVPSYDAELVRAWHRREGGFLRHLDPLRKPITTSFSQVSSDRDTFLIPELDFSQIHAFSPSLVGVLATEDQRRTIWGKPTLIGACGLDFQQPDAAADKEGRQVHDALWISVVTSGAGAACPWYWAKLVDANALYPQFASVADWTEDIDFPAEGFHPSACSIQGGTSNIWSLVGNDMAIAWIQPKGSSLQATVLDRDPQKDVGPQKVVGPLDARISELAAGRWKVEFWDPWRGLTTGSTLVNVGLDGNASVRLPKFSRDVAMKMRLLKH